MPGQRPIQPLVSLPDVDYYWKNPLLNPMPAPFASQADDLTVISLRENAGAGYFISDRKNNRFELFRFQNTVANCCDIEPIDTSCCEIELTAAFAFAGAKSLFVTLWQVDDPATTQLVISFYENLFQNKAPKHQALRKAKLGLLEDPATAHPYFWASMVGVGDMRRLP